MVVGTSLGICPMPLGAQQPGQVRYELAAAGNEARYRVREQLAGISLPGEAVGVTSAITGVVVLTSAGAVVPGTSTFVVDITGLKSDQARRDGYIERNTLQTAQFPKVELAIKELRGLSIRCRRRGIEVRAAGRSDRPRRDEAVDLAGDGHPEGGRAVGHGGHVVRIHRLRVDEAAGGVGAERGGHDRAGYTFHLVPKK